MNSPGQNCTGTGFVQVLHQYGVPPSFDYDTTGAAFFTYVNRNIDKAYTQGFNLDGSVVLPWKLICPAAMRTLKRLIPSATPGSKAEADIRATCSCNIQLAGGPPTCEELSSANGRIGFGREAFGSIDNLANSRDQKLSDAQWNEDVRHAADQVDLSIPAEIAFCTANPRTIQEAINRLTACGVTCIVAVRLFVSSYSSAITSTEYLLGLRKEAPADLAMFASMDHNSTGHAGTNHTAMEHAAVEPVRSKVPISMSSALNHHSIVSSILLDRATSISVGSFE